MDADKYRERLLIATQDVLKILRGFTRSEADKIMGTVAAVRPSIEVLSADVPDIKTLDAFFEHL